MKINILPKFHIDKWEDDYEQEFNPFYTGHNKWEEPIVNATLYIVAFLIPFSLLLLLMMRFGFAPFGENCMFAIDGAINNVPIFTQFVSQLHSGSFHLFSLQGTIGGELYSSFAFFMMSPFTLFAAIFEQQTAVGLLSLFTVLRISLSAPIFLYYLTHRQLGKRGSKYDVTLLIFALGYALSSYALIQYNDFMFIDVFMLFPLLMLGLERILCRQSARLYYITLSICLFSNFYLGIICILFSLILFFFLSGKSALETLTRFPKLLLMNACALLTSAITVIPGMVGLYRNLISSFRVQDTEWISGGFSFLLNHFFYAFPSYASVTSNGSNLYIGSFLLILICLHFLDKNLSIRRRIADFCLLLIMMFTLYFVTSNQMMQLMTGRETSFSSFTFIYLFLLLFWSFDTFYGIRNNPVWRVILSIVMPIGLGLLAMNFAKPLPSFESVNFTIDLLIIYAIILMLFRLGSIRRRVFYILIVSVSVLELLANAYQNEFSIANEEVKCSDVLYNDAASTYTGSLKTGRSEVYQDNTAEGTNMNHLFSATGTNPLLKKESLSELFPLDYSLAGLRYVYCNKESDGAPLSDHFTKVGETEAYTIYENNYALPTAFVIDGNLQGSIDSATEITRINSQAKALGATGDLLVDANITPQVGTTKPHSTRVDNLGNGIYGFSKRYDEEIESYDFNFFYRLYFQFIAPKDGELYIASPGVNYFRNVEFGKKYTYNQFDELDYFFDYITSFHAYYLDHAVLQEIQNNAKAGQCDMRYSGISALSIEATVDKESTLLTLLPYDDNYRIQLDGQSLAPDQMFSFNGQLAFVLPVGTHTVTVKCDLLPVSLGFGISIFTMLFSVCLCILRRKKVVGSTCPQPSAKHPVLTYCIDWCRDNYVYLLAALIPICFYVFLMIYTACEPWGRFTLFKNDGMHIELPGLINAVRSAQEPLHNHVWNGGGGYQYGNSTSLLYQFLPLAYVPLYSTVLAIWRIAVLGPSLIFYLTHRLVGKRADKHDFRVLIAAISYSMCSYVLMMFTYHSWFQAMFFLPLILLGMDYLMVTEKKRYYILFLALSFIRNYYMTMFICFYLVIRFFTYDFKNIKDFIKKGLSFTFCSLSMLLLCCNVILGTLAALSNSSYADTIAITATATEGTSLLPQHSFFDSWTYYINQLMFQPSSFSISWSDGNANIYLGILPILFIFVYLLSRHTSLKEKFRFLLPFGFIFFTLNESILNYIMNGLHYQNGVPNRFAFLLVITVACISFDSICLVEEESFIRLFLATLLSVGIFSVSFIFSEKTDTLLLSMSVTTVLLIVYFILCLLYRYCKKNKRQFATLLTFLFCGEILTNAFLTLWNYKSLTDIITYIDKPVAYLREEKDLDQTLERVSISAPLCTNYPWVQNVKSNQMFAAGSLTPYHLRYGSLIGLGSSINVMKCSCSATPMGNALGCNRYMIVSDYSISEMHGDYDNYNLIAIQDDNYILENPYCLPFGYYLPASVINYHTDIQSTNDFWQMIDYVVTGEDRVVSAYPLYYDDEISPKDNNKQYYQLYTSETGSPMLHAHLKAPETGTLYTMAADFQYIGDCSEGEEFDIDFDCTDYDVVENKATLTLIVFHKEAFYKLFDALSANPFVVDAFTNDTIDGHIDMPEDAIVNFAMPYDANWKAYVDGTETESVALADAFHAIYVPEGEHEIHLEYDPPKKTNWYLVIQRTSWVVFLLLCALTGYLHYRKKKFTEAEANASIPTNSEN